VVVGIGQSRQPEAGCKIEKKNSREVDQKILEDQGVYS